MLLPVSTDRPQLRVVADRVKAKFEYQPPLADSEAPGEKRISGRTHEHQPRLVIREKRKLENGNPIGDQTTN